MNIYTRDKEREVRGGGSRYWNKNDDNDDYKDNYENNYNIDKNDKNNKNRKNYDNNDTTCTKRVKQLDITEWNISNSLLKLISSLNSGLTCNDWIKEIVLNKIPKICYLPIPKPFLYTLDLFAFWLSSNNKKGVRNFPKGDFPSDNFSSVNFQNVIFPMRQLPKG